MTDRFNRAMHLAIEAHAGQVRKGTENAAGLALPYITHPVAVAALVQRYGGSEDQVGAADSRGIRRRCARAGRVLHRRPAGRGRAQAALA